MIPISLLSSGLTDDKFIACAVALKADVIVTSDRALLDIVNYMGIRILSPQQLLDEAP